MECELEGAGARTEERMLRLRDRVEKATGTRGAGIRGIRCRESILGAGYLESSWGWSLEEQGGGSRSTADVGIAKGTRSRS